MIIEIIVLILVAIISYQVGLNKGRKSNERMYQENLDVVYMQGYDAGANDQIGYEKLADLMTESIGSCDALKAPTPTVKNGAKKAAKKVTKKSK